MGVVMMMVVGVGYGRGEGCELGVLRSTCEKWPALFCWQAHDIHDFLHLVALKGNSLLAVHLGFLSLKDRPEGQEFSKDATHGPHVNCWSIMSASE